MFKEFVHDDLSGIAEKMNKTLYHLDGKVEIPHLDDILTIDGIKGIQWIPNDREPKDRDWSEIYRKISHTGKKNNDWF